MTEPESTLPVPVGPSGPPRPPRRRLRLFLLLGACVAFIAIAAPIAFFLWAGSEATQDLVRKRIVAVLEESTGGRVEIVTSPGAPCAPP
jgi:hypothetical protein